MPGTEGGSGEAEGPPDGQEHSRQRGLPHRQQLRPTKRRESHRRCRGLPIHRRYPSSGIVTCAIYFAFSW